MGKKFYQTNEFKRLQDEWYSKAAKAGFEDIEGKQSDPDVVYSQEFTMHDHLRPGFTVTSKNKEGFKKEEVPFDYSTFVQAGGLEEIELYEAILREMDFDKEYRTPTVSGDQLVKARRNERVVELFVAGIVPERISVILKTEGVKSITPKTVRNVLDDVRDRFNGRRISKRA